MTGGKDAGKDLVTSVPCSFLGTLFWSWCLSRESYLFWSGAIYIESYAVCGRAQGHGNQAWDTPIGRCWKWLLLAWSGRLKIGTKIHGEKLLVPFSFRHTFQETGN